MFNFLNSIIPTSASDAGANLHNNAKNFDARPIAQAAVSQSPIIAAARPLSDAVMGFYHGLMTGHAVGSAAPAAPAAPASPAAVAAAASGGVKAPVYTQAYLDKQPNFVEQWNATHPNDASAAAAAPQAPSNPFDEAVARFSQANNGISLNQLQALAHSAAETSPLRTMPKVQTEKDKAAGNMNELADSVWAQRQKEIAAAPPDKRGALTDSAVKERADYISRVLGANALDNQIAGQIGQGSQ